MSNQYAMSNKYGDISAIDARLAELEQEKQQLLALREGLQKSKTTVPVPNSLSLEQKIEIFRRLFRGRTDIFANRWQNQQGRSGYSVACDNEWIKGICNKPRIKCQECNHRQFSELNNQVIYRHLAGQQVVGLYPLLQDNTCYLLAADFDKGNWQEEVKAMSRACAKFDVPHAIEISRSGNGAHLWIFFKDRFPANEARLLDFGLLDTAMDFLLKTRASKSILRLLRQAVSQSGHSAGRRFRQLNRITTTARSQALGK